MHSLVIPLISMVLFTDVHGGQDLDRSKLRGPKKGDKEAAKISCESLLAFYEEEFETQKGIVESLPDQGTCLEYARKISSYFGHDATLIGSGGSTDGGLAFEGKQAIFDLWANSCALFGEFFSGGGIVVEQSTEDINCGIDGTTGWLHGEHTSLGRQNGEVLYQYSDYFTYIANFKGADIGWKYSYAQYTGRAEDFQAPA
jgi:hypothetical protein